jgi:uncharacterized protein YndB with AHSA1/START domain
MHSLKLFKIIEASPEKIRAAWDTAAFGRNARDLAIELEPLGDGATKLKLTHPAESESAAMHLYCVWFFVLEQLKSQVEDGAAFCQWQPEDVAAEVDWTMPVDAAPSAVYSLLTTPEGIARWNLFTGPGPVAIEARVGGRYSWGWSTEASRQDGPDRITALAPDRLLAFDWFVGADARKTEVSWELTPTPTGGTAIRFRHRGFAEASQRVLQWKLGWACFLYAIRYLHSGKARPLAEISGTFGDA